MTAMSEGRSRADSTEPTMPAAFDNLHIGIGLHDPETGRIVDANDRLTQLYGYTIPELRTLDLSVLSANTYGDSQHEFTRRVRTATNGSPQTFEWRIKRQDGQLRWVEITLTTRPHDDVTYVRAEVSEITNYKHNDRRMSLLQRVLRHNLRNEISVISGFADQLTDPASTIPVETCQTKITTAAQRLSRVVESITQIDETITTDTTARSRRSVKSAVDGVAADLRHTYPAATIRVTEHTALWIDVDNAFDHAVRHALENGIEHADRDTPTVTVEIDESPNTGRVEIRIDDEGPPIPAMELYALDDHHKTTPTCHGSGCGLFVMKWCLESLGGELRIEPASECGNSVYFYLPPKSPPDDAN